jgi:hypothetical protein
MPHQRNYTCELNYTLSPVIPFALAQIIALRAQLAHDRRTADSDVLRYRAFLPIATDASSQE